MKPLQNISKWAYLRWAEVVLLVTLFSGVLILINVIAYNNSKRFDLTPGKRYSLSPQSAQILNALTDDLTVTIFYKKGEGDSLKDLLELFSRADSRFNYRFLIAELRGEFADITVSAAEKVINQSLDRQAHQRIIDETLAQSSFSGQ